MLCEFLVKMPCRPLPISGDVVSIVFGKKNTTGVVKKKKTTEVVCCGKMR